MWKLSICLFLAVAIVSCNSNPSGLSNSGVPTQPLIPVTAGNTWIYTDTIFAASDTVYADTVAIGSNQLEFTGPNGNVIVNNVVESDTTGIFAGSYLGLDPSNTAVWQYDSAQINASPYIFFETANADRTALQQGTSADPTSPNCTDMIVLYGFVSTTVINGHTCLKNILTVTSSCTNAIIEQEDEYIDPGIGLVRFDDYQLNSSGVLAMDFSQTLVSTTL
jgi:hypothetical protein